MEFAANNDCVTILLVEDDPGHARLIEKHLRRGLITNPVVRLSNGQEALDYIFKDVGEDAISARYLILLDLNMPGVNGYQVLKRLKSHEGTKTIPVIVLTSADDAVEIQRCYQLGCNIYMTKPVDYEQFADAIRRLGLFLTVTHLTNPFGSIASPGT
ncbi:MAG: response regulator [Bryobacteraceae bacterium]|jgi:CheY-like chemotaxis protein